MSDSFLYALENSVVKVCFICHALSEVGLVAISLTFHF